MESWVGIIWSLTSILVESKIVEIPIHGLTNIILITNVIWFHFNTINNILWWKPNICIMFFQFLYALLLLKLYTNFYINKLICNPCMLYATFHVEWPPLKVCSLSKKGINNNIVFYNGFLGFDVHYNAHNEFIWDVFHFFQRFTMS